MVDGLGEGGGDGVDEEIWLEEAAEVVRAIGGAAGEADGGEEVFTSSFGILGEGEEVGAGGDEVRAAFYELGRESDGDFFGEEGEL